MIASQNAESDNVLDFEVVVVGGGIGGYSCAIRLGQLGRSVVLVEKEKIGGVCLNVGCIPSKALITAGKLVRDARNSGKMGISAEVSVDLPKLQLWKQSVVDKLTGGVSLLCKVNKVRVIYGTARIESPISVMVDERGGRSTRIACRDIVIATGSSSMELPNLRYDGRKILSSTEALSLSSPPKKMLIVGGGVIGLEIGMTYANLFGTEITIVELLDQLLPGVDLDLVNLVSRSLSKINAKVNLKSKVVSASASERAVDVVFETPEGKQESTVVDLVLVSVGRKPNSKEIGLEKAGIEMDGKGYVKVDRQMRTNVPNIYAIGDVAGGPLLAHKAMKEGIVAAEVIAGLKSSADWVAMPSAIFTDPEIAVVGLSRSEAEKNGIDIDQGRFPFSANGRALASPETEGFVKIIAQKGSGAILGIEIVGNEASNLISEASLAIEMGATLEDLALTVHPHPTLSEAVMEAAENALGKSIHVQNRSSRPTPQS